MQPFKIDDIHATTLANIEAEIIDAIDDYNAAVAAISNHPQRLYRTYDTDSRYR
jgi:hypothetical protein